MTPFDRADLLNRAAGVAGYDRAGEPWYTENAGRFVPKLVDAVNDLEKDLQDKDVLIDTLRNTCRRLAAERDEVRGLLRAVDALLEDTANLADRATVQRNSITETIGAKGFHEQDTIPPAPPVPETEGEAAQ